MKNKIYTNLFYITFFVGLILNIFFFFKSTEIKDYQNFFFWVGGFPLTLICTKLVNKSKYGWYSMILLSGYLFYSISKTIEPYFLEFNYNWNKEFININSNFAQFFPLKYFTELFSGITSFSIVLNVLFWIVFLIFSLSYVIQPITQRNRTYNGLFSLIAAHALLLIIFPVSAAYLNQNELYSGDSFNIANEALNNILHINKFTIGSLPVAIITYISAILFRENIILGIFMFIFVFFVILSQIVLNYCYLTDIVISFIAGITAFLGVAGGMKKSEYF